MQNNHPLIFISAPLSTQTSVLFLKNRLLVLLSILFLFSNYWKEHCINFFQEWYDYDEKAGESVSISEAGFQFVHVKQWSW